MGGQSGVRQRESEQGRAGWVVTQLPLGSAARWIRIFGQERATRFGFSAWALRAFARKGEALGVGPLVEWKYTRHDGGDEETLITQGPPKGLKRPRLIQSL